MADAPQALDREGQARRAGFAARAVNPFEAVPEAAPEAAPDAGRPMSGADRIKAANAAAVAGDVSSALSHLWRIVDGQESYPAWLSAARVLSRLQRDGRVTMPRQLRVAVLATWNTTEFCQLLALAAARCGIAVTVLEPPFGQYFNQTLDAQSELYAQACDVILLCPDHRATGLDTLQVDPEQALHDQLNRWRMVWESIRRNSAATIIQHGFALPALDAFGHLGPGIPGGRGSLLRALNEQLASAARQAGVGFVDIDALAAQFGKSGWFDDRNWHWAKIALSSRALPTLARHTAAVLAGRVGLSRRCLVMDLDNTLWGGVIGDDGLGGIRLGGGPDGEAFQEFQRTIKALASRGIVLAVCSKNDPEIARQAFTQHPEMILRLADIAVFEAGWGPKSSSIERIAAALDLGLEALTFVDDNPYEREQVRAALPAVDVLELPEDPSGYAAALAAYPYFEISAFTAEDRDRGRQYQARGAARQLEQQSTSLADYQARLNMVATVGPVIDVNLDRVVQLINKTNQFNLTTRRRNREEVIALLDRPDVELLQFRLRDCFADHGLVAVAIGVDHGAAFEIDTLLMSCRVIGRGLERVIVNELAERAGARGCPALEAWYRATERNGLVRDLYAGLGFEQVEAEQGGALWRRATSVATDDVPFITIERA